MLTAKKFRVRGTDKVPRGFRDDGRGAVRVDADGKARIQDGGRFGVKLRKTDQLPRKGRLSGGETFAIKGDKKR